jgi:hypothetical protein
MIDLDTAAHLLRGLKKDVRAIVGRGFSVEMRFQQFLVTAEELQAYLDHKATLKKSGETQLSQAGYYEHAVQFEGAPMRRASYRRGEDVLRLVSADTLTTIAIGRPSTLFCLSLTDTDEMGRDLRRLSAFGPLYRDSQDIKPLSDMFRLSTIKVSTASDSPLGRSPSRMHDIAEAAIFHFAYGKGIPITFTKSWERTYYWLGRKESETVQFPLRTYNSELVSYYNLALSSDSLVLGYLALYKILEYFYTHVSENSLHDKIKDHLVAPDFVHTKTKKLRELVKTIRQFDSRLDELVALQLVLSNFFDKSELRNWITAYESVNGQYFSVDVDVMNSKMKVDISDNTIFPNIARRIYMIRNALVHNKEGEIARFIPYSGQEEALHKEVQILIFIAEQLIIKSGKDLA